MKFWMRNMLWKQIGFLFQRKMLLEIICVYSETTNYTQNIHTSWKEEPLEYNNIMYYMEKSRTYRSKDFFDIEHVYSWSITLYKMIEWVL